MKNLHLYRATQFVGFLLGARIFTTALLTFALYVSAFFLFSREESLREAVFDFRVHAIIFCTVLCVLAGGIINQFYDRDKDRFTRPLRTRLQKFLQQKYFLYAYLTLNIISLGIALLISPRVFIFFLLYQFLMWFYSHKLSKILIINNLSFVVLTVYPFFGLWVYYKTFSGKVFLMAVFLFVILLIIDITKDLLTRNADRIFGYETLATRWGSAFVKKVIRILCVLLFALSLLIIYAEGLHTILNLYFTAGLFVLALNLRLLFLQQKKSAVLSLTLLRMWLFVGIIAMLLDGIVERF